MIIRRRNLSVLAIAAVSVLLTGGCNFWSKDESVSGAIESVATSTPAATSTMTPRPTATKTPTPRPTATPTATPTPEPTTQADVAAAYLMDVANEWSETESVHLVLDIDGDVYLDAGEQLEFRGAEGNLVRPDSSSVDATIYGGIIEFDVSLIFIGDDGYMTNFITGRWEEAPSNLDFNPSLLFSETQGIGAVLQELDDPETAGYGQIEGRTARRICGTVSGDQIDDLVGGVLQGDEIAVDVWMDVGNDQLLRIKLAETEGDEDDQITWDITFSRHNAPVLIERPDV